MEWRKEREKQNQSNVDRTTEHTKEKLVPFGLKRIISSERKFFFQSRF